ncbi:transcription factor ILR3-like isoform X1 [Bidens hawaiensis]|uniref:transcription factor ILR3-like isoform X1 n=1 Tax=Bidens hawaiensis TaxID=980011 RepID=UPI00404BA067
MVSPETTNWIYDYGGFIDDSINITLPDGNNNFIVSGSGFTWPIQSTTFNGSSSNPSGDLDGSIVDSDGHNNDSRSMKRGRGESCSGTSSKACREKLRRDKLNDKFVELASILDPGRPPKIDKAAILVDAVHVVTQLRKEAQKLKDSSLDLQEKIKELKAEKNELRDEKQRLKMEKEKLEQQVNSMNPQPTFMAPPAIPAAYAQGQVGNKLVPVISYPGMGMAMWQFMPPAAVDTSQDHVLHPPVA